MVEVPGIEPFAAITLISRNILTLSACSQPTLPYKAPQTPTHPESLLSHLSHLSHGFRPKTDTQPFTPNNPYSTIKAIIDFFKYFKGNLIFIYV
jgi:hypothetical protein